MDFVEMRRGKVLVEMGAQEAANLLDILLEVTAQWSDLDTVPLSASLEEVIELRRSMLTIVELIPDP